MYTYTYTSLSLYIYRERDVFSRGRLNCAITTKLNYAMAMFLTVTFKWS